jgi:hypothetical protein
MPPAGTVCGTPNPLAPKTVVGAGVPKLPEGAVTPLLPKAVLPKLGVPSPPDGWLACAPKNGVAAVDDDGLVVLKPPEANPNPKPAVDGGAAPKVVAAGVELNPVDAGAGVVPKLLGTGGAPGIEPKPGTGGAAGVPPNIAIGVDEPKPRTGVEAPDAIVDSVDPPRGTAGCGFFESGRKSDPEAAALGLPVLLVSTDLGASRVAKRQWGPSWRCSSVPAVGGRFNRDDGESKRLRLSRCSVA